MNYVVRTTPKAEAQIRNIDRCWRRNRPASADLFLDELSAAFGMIGHIPMIGRPYRRAPITGVRRILLRLTRYHVYYVTAVNEVRVLAVWHARRESAPRFRS
ncbi:MAG TPA: type II toxin-antitoxin system RelE/ParE family toxin [Candidatus Binataceae bacterium]|nr:type II toxin-antitoxin system RelE/ParE family toxin [Candidatus Binataceae bacterium]